MGARNNNWCVSFAPDTKTTKLQLFQLFLFGYFIERVLLHNENERIEGEKVSYGWFLVFIGVWIIIATIQGPYQREFW